MQLLTNKIETDNQRYIEQIATVKSSRSNMKFMAITKIREQTTVGVRLAKVLHLANIRKKNYFIPHLLPLPALFQENTNY